jgi:hypothetical protein
VKASLAASYTWGQQSLEKRFRDVYQTQRRRVLARVSIGADRG